MLTLHIKSLENIFSLDFNSSKLCFTSKVFRFLIIPFLIIACLIALGSVSKLTDFFLGVLLLMGVIILFKQKDTFPEEVKIYLLIAISIALMVIVHAFWGNDLERLFKFQFANLRNMLFLPLLFAVIYHTKLSPQGVWRIIVIAGLYTFIYLIFVIIEKPERSTGLLESAVVLGNTAMMFALLSFVALFAIKGFVWKLLAVVVVVSGIALSLLSGTRTGLTALIVTGIILLWTLYRLDKEKFYYSSLMVLVFLGMSWLFWDSISVYQRVEQGVQSLYLYLEGNSNTSLGARFDMWKIALAGFLEKPIFGWGVKPYEDVFTDYVKQGYVNFVISEAWPARAQPHNDYLLVLFQFGIVGFILIMALFIFPVWFLIKKMFRAEQKGQLELFYLCVTGLVVTEVIMDFMLFNLALMNQIFYVYVITIFLVMSVVFRVDRTKN